MRHLTCVFLLVLCGPAAAAAAADTAAPGTDGLELTVTLDPAGQSGRAAATIRIHAPPEAVWPLIASCDEERRIVPGLLACDVLETAPDHSWQRIRHVMDYSWYMPRLTYEVRATYHRPDSVSVERTSGDLAKLRGSWTLLGAGGDTVAHYVVEFEPGFWVPNWIIRAALKRDLPKMLRNLRARAESGHDE
jgi:ribosome-associated toxin RatA of RatAB toxin-antitoxin module